MGDSIPGVVGSLLWDVWMQRKHHLRPRLRFIETKVTAAASNYRALIYARHHVRTLCLSLPY